MQEFFVSQEPPDYGFLGAERYKSSLLTGVHHAASNYLEGNTDFDYQQFTVHQELQHNVYIGFEASRQNGGDVVPLISEFIPAICPPPSAFLRPKCALWDCPRPAQGSEWYQDYCSSFHATLALHEGPPGMTPVLRPGGIDLKDGPLFAYSKRSIMGIPTMYPWRRKGRSHPHFFWDGKIGKWWDWRSQRYGSTYEISRESKDEISKTKPTSIA